MKFGPRLDLVGDAVCGLMGKVAGAVLTPAAVIGAALRIVTSAVAVASTGTDCLAGSTARHPASQPPIATGYDEGKWIQLPRCSRSWRSSCCWGPLGSSSS